MYYKHFLQRLLFCISWIVYCLVVLASGWRRNWPRVSWTMTWSVWWHISGVRLERNLTASRMCPGRWPGVCGDIFLASGWRGIWRRVSWTMTWSVWWHISGVRLEKNLTACVLDDDLECVVTYFWCQAGEESDRVCPGRWLGVCGDIFLVSGWRRIWPRVPWTMTWSVWWHISGVRLEKNLTACALDGDLECVVTYFWRQAGEESDRVCPGRWPGVWHANRVSSPPTRRRRWVPPADDGLLLWARAHVQVMTGNLHTAQNAAFQPMSFTGMLCGAQRWLKLQSFIWGYTYPNSFSEQCWIVCGAKHWTSLWCEIYGMNICNNDLLVSESSTADERCKRRSIIWSRSTPLLAFWKNSNALYKFLRASCHNTLGILWAPTVPRNVRKFYLRFSTVYAETNF